MALSFRHPRTLKDYAFLLAAIVMSIVTLVAIGVVIRYGFAVNRLSRGIGQTMFYGADGTAWFPLEEHRRDVPLNRISPHLRDAVVAVEDHRFQRHLGIDPIGLGRAIVRDVRALSLAEGGSTLTQQLARTLFLSGSRDFTRKGKEAILALMIEQRLSKTQILELYLNRIYLGGAVYGVEAMSQNLFGKPAANLTLSEAAFIGGLIRMPSALWPWSHYDRALRRSHLVLARMRQERFITPEAEQQARATPPRILASPGPDTRRGWLRARTIFARSSGPHSTTTTLRTGRFERPSCRRCRRKPSAPSRRASRSSVSRACKRPSSPSIHIPATYSRSSVAATSSAHRSIAPRTRSGSPAPHSNRLSSPLH